MRERDDPHRYDDLLDRPRPVSARPRMPSKERAAQFLPFAALTGFDAILRETARYTDARVELSEEEKLALGEKLAILAERAGEQPLVRVVYFQADERKEGGSCREVTARVAKVRLFEEELLLEVGGPIAFGDILSLEGELFPGL